MHFNSVTIQNFLSMKHGEVELNERGLTLIEGENIGNTAFKSNGAGKSILPDAITFCLYGVTVRDLKNDEVINEKVGKNCGVVMTLTDDDGVEYEIGRYRNHKDFANNVIIRQNGNDISRSTISDNNRFIEELVGLSHTAFTNSVVFGQGVVKYFASYTDKEKKQVLEQLLEVTIYERALNHIKELQKVSASEYKGYVIKIQDKDEHIAQEKSRLEELKEMQNNFENRMDERKELMEGKIARKKKEGRKMKRERAKLKELISNLSEGLDSYDSEEHTKAVKLVNELSEKSLSTSLELEHHERYTKDANREMKKTLDKIEGTCPVCLRKVEEGDDQHVINEYSSIIKHHEAVVKKNKTLLKRANIKLKKAKVISEEFDAQYKIVMESRQEHHSRERELKLLNKDITRVVNEFNELTEELGEINNEQGYSEVIQKSEDLLTSLAEKRTLLMRDKDLTEETINYYKFWEVGFGHKGIKALLFDSVIPFLNETVGKYIDILSDNSIEIKFSSFKELKTKGKTKEEFDVRITNKKGSKNYKGNSGGERRRVDLAILLAFQKLVSSRSTKRVNFVIYDEIFENLDAIGTEKVVSLLRDVYSDNSSCFIITHNSHLKSYFPGTLKVIKQNGVSHYEEVQGL